MGGHEKEKCRSFGEAWEHLGSDLPLPEKQRDLLQRGGLFVVANGSSSVSPISKMLNAKQRISPNGWRRSRSRTARFGPMPTTAFTTPSRTGLSPVRFARLIKRIYRITPGQLINKTRLGIASQTLIETPLPVIEVAHACGFYDQSAFARAFKRRRPV
ncbi:MAG: helix-turn-helix transcriptional regulator [Verrucomicrobia bacterium]|nr:helix-turn-helix transcriptional regulator [Verrucomicrobiota bacterium]